ncbi:MAG: hypothetical protein U1F33_14240 [Alphaproteobacteria bacterium]
MIVRTIVVAGGILVAATGCDERRATLSPNFGNAVRHNIAIQTINPNPNDTAIPPDLNGERAAEVIDRYIQGEIRPAPSFAPPTTNLSGGTGK